MCRYKACQSVLLMFYIFCTLIDLKNKPWAAKQGHFWTLIMSQRRQPSTSASILGWLFQLNTISNQFPGSLVCRGGGLDSIWCRAQKLSRFFSGLKLRLISFLFIAGVSRRPGLGSPLPQLPLCLSTVTFLLIWSKSAHLGATEVVSGAETCSPLWFTVCSSIGYKSSLGHQ